MTQLSEPILGELAGERFGACCQDERRRIARELHDRVCHELALALQHLDLHQHLIGREPERAQAKLAAAVAALIGSLRAIQHLAAELRNPVGADGIEPALRDYLAANVPGTIRAHLTVTGDAAALPAQVSEQLYLIVREAARNAMRHADPTELHLSVRVTRTAVIATVVDNGRGLAPALHHGGGLSSMAERAELLRGTLELASEPRRGTSVRLRVPLTGGRP
jgi:signal transduction histidine kinase